MLVGFPSTLTSFLQGAAFEAVCEELEVGAVICDGGGERIFEFTAKNYDYNIVVVMESIMYQVKRDLLRRVGRTVDRDVVIATSSLRLPLDKVATSDA